MSRRPPHPILRQLGARLRTVRTDATWTQEQLAAAIDVAPNTISRFENGHLSLRVTTLANLAEALQVGLGDLLDIERPLPAAAPPAKADDLVRVFLTLDGDRQDLATRLVREVARSRAKDPEDPSG